MGLDIIKKKKEGLGRIIKSVVPPLFTLSLSLAVKKIAHER